MSAASGSGGSTGNSTGPHLRFTTGQDPRVVGDPIFYDRADRHEISRVGGGTPEASATPVAGDQHPWPGLSPDTLAAALMVAAIVALGGFLGGVWVGWW